MRVLTLHQPWADPVTLTELARAALAHTMAAHPADDVVGPL